MDLLLLASKIKVRLSNLAPVIVIVIQKLLQSFAFSFLLFLRQQKITIKNLKTKARFYNKYFNRPIVLHKVLVELEVHDNPVCKSLV